jgi:2-keto-4-pentenoate hydratase/2-oxohepta-3-ene-1,7-dioic acid hydratase in catechol pathway
MMNKLRIHDTEKFIKVNNIFCIGRNYVDHIKEMNNSDIPKIPMVFIKPNSAIVNDEGFVEIPKYQGKEISENLHYEVELVVVISRNGKNIDEHKAEKYILGYAVGLDMTLRDIQDISKKNGTPWSVSKGFYSSAPVSDILLKSSSFNPMKIALKLVQNGVKKQHSNTELMIFNIYKLISYISSIFLLNKYDIIFTGTPAGVGKAISGDRIEAILDDKLKLSVKVK